MKPGSELDGIPERMRAQELAFAVLSEKNSQLDRRVKTLEMLVYSALTGIAGVVGLAIIGLVIRNAAL